jgi:hypothetical protein
VSERPLLVVVIVRDAGLRSSLAAQLGGMGVNLLTAEATNPGGFDRRLIRAPSILIIDEEEIAGDQGSWIEGQWLDRAWDRVVVLSDDAPVPVGDDNWLVYVDKHAPMRALSELLGRWTQQEHQANDGVAPWFEVQMLGSA